MRSDDLEPARLARVLHRAHDLAREHLAAQLVVEREVERDRVRRLALDLVALERLEAQLQVVGVELVLGAVDVDADRPPLAQRLGDVRRVERGDRGRRPAASPCRSAGRASGSSA